ncbi:MAG: FAD:protein FMN transferase [Oscillospiraceae bacterium]
MPGGSKAAAAFLTILLLLSGCTAQTIPQTKGVEFVMNTFVEQLWQGEESQAAYDEILGALKALEANFSLYNPTGEISQLNDAAGLKPVSLSGTTYGLLRRAASLGSDSGGIFDITIAPLTLCWNITGEHSRIPTKAEIDAAKALVDYRDLIFDDAAQTVMLRRKGMSVDLGGIAKGMAAGAMRPIAEKHGVQGYLSLGGNMMVVGKKFDGSDWRIGIRNPRGTPNDSIASVTLEGMTMATTGDYERYFEENGVRYHHVLDPFTGYPSDRGLISVTVISADGTLADCLSTTIFLEGRDRLNNYLLRDDCMVLAVTKQMEVYASPALWEQLSIDYSDPAFSWCRSMQP